MGGGDDGGPNCLQRDDVTSGDLFLYWSQKPQFPTKVAFHADRRRYSASDFADYVLVAPPRI